MYKIFNNAEELAKYLVNEIRDERVWSNLFNNKIFWAWFDKQMPLQEKYHNDYNKLRNRGYNKELEEKLDADFKEKERELKQEYINKLTKDIENKIDNFPIGFKYWMSYADGKSTDYENSVLPFRDAIKENIKTLENRNMEYCLRIKENQNRINEFKNLLNADGK